MDWIKKNTAYGRPWFLFSCVCICVRLVCTFYEQNITMNPRQPNGNPENSPALSECATKKNKKHWKWNGISPFFSFRHTLWLPNETKNERVFFVLVYVCVCVGTTREFNDNRKMVFPCSYLNMLSGSERSSFVSHYAVVDNIFHLVWQAFSYLDTCIYFLLHKHFGKETLERKKSREDKNTALV